MEAARQVKMEGKSNDLLERIIADPYFKMTEEELRAAIKPENFIGRAPQQVTEFLEEYIQPILKEHQDDIRLDAQLTV